VNERSMSNGAAWDDIDNDGEPDIVVNNINKEAFVLINNPRQVKDKPVTSFNMHSVLYHGDYARATCDDIFKGCGRSCLAIPPVRSGFMARGDVKDTGLIRLARGPKMGIIGINNDSLKVMGINSMK